MNAQRPSDEENKPGDRVRLFPDLVATVAWTLATAICISTPYLHNTPLVIIFGLPMVLFIPGYVLVAGLFPKRGDITIMERLALSFGLSIAVVPLLGLALNYTPWGIRLHSIFATLVLFTAAMAIIAQSRRSQLPNEERFNLPLGAIARDIASGLFSPDKSRLDRTLIIILIAIIIVAIATTVYVIAFPREGEHFTQFYILGENGKLAGYPEQFAAGDPQTVIIGIGNHEYRTVTYTVETILLNMTFDPATNTSKIHAVQPLYSFTATLVHNETQEYPYTFSVPDTHYNRLQFLLFNETMPIDDVETADCINASYQDLHLWITVLNPPEIEP